MFHVNGSMPPGMPFCPEELNIDAYAPPGLLHEFLTMGPALARMAQIFAEDIGTPTVARWETAFSELSLRYGSPPPIKHCSRPHFIPIMPDARKETPTLFSLDVLLALLRVQ
ncbi:hypothetical protein A0H81_05686 [Grifola frondosa]|uniref:Uncharacterized protein n=1 Tax=Grifola frondosa TaxID=5627 RepID=A0A1C7MBR8_GRIFR|nr:hypothetical protein A0H81_05686 [Grifola frondosa]